MTKVKRKEERKLRTKQRHREWRMSLLRRRAENYRAMSKRMKAAGYTYDHPTRTWKRS